MTDRQTDRQTDRHSLLSKFFLVRREGVSTVIRVLGLKIKIPSKNKQAQARVMELKRYQDSGYGKMYNAINDAVRRWSTPARLYVVNIMLTEHCNFNCFACGNFSQLVEPEYADIDVVTRDLTKLAELTGGAVDYIQLTGGEPLLHPNVISFFEISRKLFPDSRIRFITNGILLPKQGVEFWEAVKKYKVTLAPTRYPEIDWDKVESYAAQFGVELQYLDGVERESLYRPFDTRGVQNETMNFSMCPSAGQCQILKDGRFYLCIFPAVIRHFNKHFNQSLEVSKFDYIELDKVQSVQEILSLVARPLPFCRYCNIWGHKRMGTHLLSNRDISEYVMPEQIKDI
ncbi:hypothetical protein RsTz2092_11520 [Deferribacterales bacterium RsTz2092]|nr:hypothetical protein AGMMS49941_10670 [Deferribacterales bacterium]